MFGRKKRELQRLEDLQQKLKKQAKQDEANRRVREAIRNGDLGTYREYLGASTFVSWLQPTLDLAELLENRKLKGVEDE